MNPIPIRSLSMNEGCQEYWWTKDTLEITYVNLNPFPVGIVISGSSILRVNPGEVFKIGPMNPTIANEITIHYGQELRVPKCECGSEIARIPGHSTWCPKHKGAPA